MSDTRMRFFGNLHPAVSMAYFVLVLGLTLGCMHPVTVALSFLGASWFSIRLRGWKAYGQTMRFVGPIFLLIALANPLFNHRGVTMCSFFVRLRCMAACDRNTQPYPPIFIHGI